MTMRDIPTIMSAAESQISDVCRKTRDSVTCPLIALHELKRAGSQFCFVFKKLPFLLLRCLIVVQLLHLVKLQMLVLVVDLDLMQLQSD